jgi:hypothetical protein
MAIAYTTAKPVETKAVLLTPAQLAERLAVPASWVKEKTRTRALERDSDPLPCVRLGRYVRFDWNDVLAWIERQKQR